MRKTTLFFATALTVLLGACSDNDAVKPDHQQGVAVSFTASAQENSEEEANQTRSIVREGEDAPKVYTIEGSEETLYLLERTEEGIDYPTAQLDSTRGTVVVSTLDNDFSAIGYKGASATSISTTPWFHNEKADMAGALYNYIPWDASNPFANFYGVYPYADGTNGITLSGASYAGVPYLDYVNPTDATQQVDLLTACTPSIEYTTRTLPLASRVAPAVNLHFRHALTAIKFRMGNLPATTTITKVVFKNAASTGRYFMGTDAAGTGANWSTVGTPTDFTLDLTSNPVTVAGKVAGGYILGDGDGYTFFMIPQQLSGNNVEVEITLDNAGVTTTITATLTGFWREGYTRVYTLSQEQTDWVYTITASDASALAANYKSNVAGVYMVNSYREDALTGDKQPVTWKVVSYEESTDNGETWTTSSTTRPSWITNLSTYQGGAVLKTDSVFAVLEPTLIDSLDMYNAVMRNAAQRGTSAAPWDLSTHDYKGNSTAMNTANSYLISAPGYYRIPLVYGNAIKNGATNQAAYQPTATPTSDMAAYFLTNFKDHLGQDITNPYIYFSQNYTYVPDGAKLVWADKSGLISDAKISWVGPRGYLDFTVPASTIANGNAVLAATMNGTVVWSWHLWFAQDDALDTTPFANYAGTYYNFANYPLGYYYRSWDASAYSQNRIVRVTVQQTVSNNGVAKTATYNITQAPGSSVDAAMVSVQLMRKEVFPEVATDVVEGAVDLSQSIDDVSFANAIQHPEIAYRYTVRGNGTSSFSYLSKFSMPDYLKVNYWSANKTTSDNSDGGIKTVYDPNPVGYKMRGVLAYTGFSSNGGTIHTADNKRYGGQTEKGILLFTNDTYTSKYLMRKLTRPMTCDVVIRAPSLSGITITASYQLYPSVDSGMNTMVNNSNYNGVRGSVIPIGE